ncbi:MAG: HD domain-containing protein, partial [Acidobacteria bacterium]|nr:HD domain-containing protein [Acidobacteriota bacterium]
MPKGNWKSLTLLCAVVGFAASLLALSLGGLWSLTSHGLLLCLGLLCLTVAASRFNLPLNRAESFGKTYKSVADAFIFLAGMMFGPAPAALLAGVDGFFSSRGAKDHVFRVYTTATSVASTSAAVFVYQFIAQFTAGPLANDGQHFAPLGSVLFPLCVLALVQYALNIVAAAAYVALESGTRLKFHREEMIWTSMAQVAGGVAAALFYSGLGDAGLPFLLIGLLIIGLVYMLYRFDEKRVEEIRHSEEEKLRHIQEIADLHMNTIESLAVAIDAKDQTTHGHVRRTQIYAMELGRMLGVGDQELLALQAGALLHDVGKLAVPEYILNKPGKLTAAEFDKMKIHTVVGGDIIKRVNFPYPVEDIVRFHHEKWDGTGYPRGLKAEQIPLVARIIAVVDFFDATRCDRPYRLGMKREDSIGLLRRMAGSS